MELNRSAINAVVSELSKFYTIEPAYNATDFLIVAENSQGINEFEARLALASFGAEEPSVGALLDRLVDIQAVRSDFHIRYNLEWQARYTITAV